jgi:ribosome maturation factor RimP
MDGGGAMVTATKRQPSRVREASAVIERVRPAAEAVAAAQGLTVWDIAFGRDAGRETLRVSCDRVGGVTADELGAYSEQLSSELDREDAVPGEAQYVLEVTSPGAERKLVTRDHFEICVGRVARVVLKDGRTIEGPIAGTTEHAIEISGEEETTRALFDDIARAQLVVKF